MADGRATTRFQSGKSFGTKAPGGFGSSPKGDIISRAIQKANAAGAFRNPSPSFEMPNFAGQFQDAINSQNEMWRELQAQREQQAREAERRAGMQEIDKLLAARTQA